MNEIEGPTTMTWIGLIVGILYAILPVDLIPDVVPVAGWVDDLVITGTGVLNFIQAEVGRTSETLAALLGIAKWILIILGVIAILLIIAIGGLVYNIFK